MGENVSIPNPDYDSGDTRPILGMRGVGGHAFIEAAGVAAWLLDMARAIDEAEARGFRVDLTRTLREYAIAIRRAASAL